MNVISEYFFANYITLTILVTINVIGMVSRKHQLKGIKLIQVMTLVVFLISIAEYFGIWIKEYNKSYRLLYYKSAAVYILYPLLAMLLLYVAVDVRYKYLLMLPFIIAVVLSLVDISGMGLLYNFDENYNFTRGPLGRFSVYVEVFYILLLAMYSIVYIRKKNISKGIITLFMAVSVILTQIMLQLDYPNQNVPPVCAMVVLTYYFYLSAIQYNETQEELARNRLRLEQNKTNLLMAQIRPHFINSNLAVIRSLCYEEPEKAVEMIDHFSEYLRENVKQIDDHRLVPFEAEMESVDNYLYLEMQRFQDRLCIEKDLETMDFEVPPLSIQTIVENAVRHGISMTGVKGTIWIMTRKTEDETVIIVKDNGKGFDQNKVDFDGVEHVGVKNVKDRFKRLLDGNVEITSKVGEGTVVTFHIPAVNE